MHGSGSVSVGGQKWRKTRSIDGENKGTDRKCRGTEIEGVDQFRGSQYRVRQNYDKAGAKGAFKYFSRIGAIIL